MKAEEQTEDLILCPQGCGRKFNKDSLLKHYKVCKDVFQQKRSAFNSQLKRVGFDYFIENKQKLPQFSPPKTTKLKTEILPYRSPQVSSKYNQILNAKKFCKGCLREFDFRIADDHIQKCVQKNKQNNPFTKII
ncbi:unnamed protein product [Paramecium pentaurelia]|uniref:C2HC/C3H-type domain-containing protein n=1 Tax=Paramecium pentaurelia TaxID=43138 RepID=A0A8S1U5Q7_9CILI|nr:unnamed protein product [Paramecium pentaurelia]